MVYSSQGTCYSSPNGNGLSSWGCPVLNEHGEIQVKAHWILRITCLTNLKPVWVTFMGPCLFLMLFPLTTWIINSAVSLSITYISYIDLYIKLRRLVLQCYRSISSPYFSRDSMAQSMRLLFAFHCQGNLASHSMHRFLSISGPHLDSQNSLKPQHPDRRPSSSLLLPFTFKSYRKTDIQ